MKEIEDLDQQMLTMQKENDRLEISKKGLERKFEFQKKNLNEKVNQCNVLISGEQENAEIWRDRYDTEQKEHRKTNAYLMQLKGECRDL